MALARRVIRDIWNEIWRARVISADVSGANPNVNYELGLCHSLGVPTIIITKRMEDVPFDYRDRRCIVYDTNRARWENHLTQKLQRTIKEIIEAASDDDLPWPYDTTTLTQLASASSTITVENPRENMLRGIAALERVISRAYGPRGENVSVRLGLEVMSHKKGLAIARGFRSANAIEDNSIEQMRRACEEIDQRIGDGGKTTVLISHGILTNAHNAIARGHEVGKLVKGMESAIAEAVASLKKQAKPLVSDALYRIALTSSADEKIATSVAEGMRRAGLDVSRLQFASESERIAAGVIASALELPFRTLVDTAGMDSTQMIEERRAASEPSIGFNPEAKRLNDFSDAGALDPVKLLRVTLEVAFSHARMILKTGAWSHSEQPESQQEPE